MVIKLDERKIFQGQPHPRHWGKISVTRMLTSNLWQLTFLLSVLLMCMVGD